MAMAMEDKVAVIKGHLQDLRIESRSSTELRDAMELLIKVTRNTLPPKGQEVDSKFHKINPSNADFNRKIWTSPAARSIVLAAGWVRVGEGREMRLVHHHDPDTYITGHELIEILVENRNIVPSADEWVDATKTETVVTSQEQFRRDQLRGIAESRAQYENALKEKKERKELAEFIKKEHRAQQNFLLQRRHHY